MKIKEVSYSKTFGLPGSKDPFEKIILTAELEGEETPREVLYSLRKQAHDFHFESNKAAEKQAKEETGPPLSQEAKIIAQIYGTSDLKVLESFNLLAGKYPAVKAAYEQQEKSCPVKNDLLT